MDHSKHKKKKKKKAKKSIRRILGIPPPASEGWTLDSKGLRWVKRF